MGVNGNGGAGTPAGLIGRWRLIRADDGLEFAPDARMEFQRGGRLLYDFAVGERRQVMHLLYRVEGDILHTDHPAASHARSTHFHFGAGEVLARALKLRVRQSRGSSQRIGIVRKGQRGV